MGQTFQSKKFLKSKFMDCWDDVVMSVDLQSVSDTLSNDTMIKYGFFLLAMKSFIEENVEDDILMDSIINRDFVETLKFGSEKKPSLKNEGIDAVYVDETNKIVNFFYFIFSPDFGTSTKEIKIPTSFYKDLDMENSSLSTILSQFGIEREFEENDLIDYSFSVFVVSNGLFPEKNNILALKSYVTENLDGKVNVKGHEELLDVLGFQSESIGARIQLNDKQYLDLTNASTGNFFIFYVSLAELIRITCKNPEYRINTSLAVKDSLTASIDVFVLSSNVRGYTASRSFIRNMNDTIKNEPYNFSLYNNGITMVAKKIQKGPLLSGNFREFTLEDIKILNGGQTLRTIYQFIDEKKQSDGSISESDMNDLIDWYCSAFVTIKAIPTEEEQLEDSISLYANTQNKVNADDLKSTKQEQQEIGEKLAKEGIYYQRKRGEKDKTRNCGKSITMQRFAQIIWSMMGNPDEASNKKKSLFEENYDKIFTQNDLLSKEFSSVIKAIRSFYEVQEFLKTRDSYYQLKVFYILYLAYEKNNWHILKKCTHDFEEFLKKVIRKNEKESRTLIHPATKILMRYYFDLTIKKGDELFIKENFNEEDWILPEKLKKILPK